MDTLKDKLPVIGIGLAAIAIAGYIVFGLDKKKEVPKQQPQKQVEEAIEAEIIEEEKPALPLNHFIEWGLNH